MTAATIVEARGLSGQVSFDGNSVRITRRGLFPWLLFGSGGVKTFPLKSITAVQHRRCGWYKGYLQFSVQGELEYGSGRTDITPSLIHDENTVVFYFRAQQVFQSLATMLNAAIAAGSQPVASHLPDSPLRQIEDLGRMRDAGYLTEAEYAEKKQVLLSRI